MKCNYVVNGTKGSFVLLPTKPLIQQITEGLIQSFKQEHKYGAIIPVYQGNGLTGTVRQFGRPIGHFYLDGGFPISKKRRGLTIGRRNVPSFKKGSK
jgi:hypothetical protein